MNANRKMTGILVMLRRRVGSFVLLSISIAFLTLAVAPSSARAIAVYDASRTKAMLMATGSRISSWLEVTALESAILSLVIQITSEFILFMEELETQVNTDSAVGLAAKAGVVKAEVKIGQAKIDAGVKTSYLEAASAVQAENVPPQNEQLCNAIVANKGSLDTEQFERGVKNLALSAVESLYRSATDDGAGPQAAYDSLYNRCTMKLGNSADGYADECVDANTTGTDGRKLTDADMRAATLDGGQVLELPPMTTKTVDGVSYQVPDPQTTEQKFWVAGLYYCVNMAGARPTPPSKEQIKTPGGLTMRANWDHCAAAQSALTSACTAVLAFYTRPNSTYTDLITAQKKTYDAVVSFGVNLPDSFESGTKGLSPYQELSSVQAICKSNQFYVSKSEDGASHPEMSNSVERCSSSWTSWQMLQNKIKYALVKSVTSMAKLPECWQQTGN